MRDLTSMINEARKLEYRVCLCGCHNTKNDDLPVDVTILVDPIDADAFEAYLEKEQDNFFSHASGGRNRVEY